MSINSKNEIGYQFKKLLPKRKYQSAIIPNISIVTEGTFKD